MKKICFMALFMLGMWQAHSQKSTINGIVTDATGPLPGVNIMIKGGINGVQTDFDGYYEIEAENGDILVYSFVGYTSVERLVGDKTVINVILEEDSALLEEIVVTASGTKPSLKIRGYSGYSVHRPTSNFSGIEPGQMTAAEINDLDNWKDWKKIRRHRDFKNMEQNWGFYLKERIKVTASDRSGFPAANIPVYLYTNGCRKIFTARTDALGEAQLFIDKETYASNDYFIIQLVSKKGISGKKITKTHKSVQFTIDNADPDNMVNIMFTIDATGSMHDEMNYLKAELKNIISRADESIDAKRIALTFYRDHGDAFVVKNFDFNTDINEVQSVLQEHNAAGGGDYEEAVELALKRSLNQSWNTNARSRLLFLLLDAPPHLNDDNVDEISKQIKRAQAQGIKIIPIVASDADKRVEYLMRNFSVATNGTYVFITDDSGIGRDHLEPTISKYRVEKLNDLIVRLIDKYAGKPLTL